MAKKPVAATAHASSALPPAMDYPEHEKTYRGFITLAKYSAIIAAVSIAVLYFLVRP